MRFISPNSTSPASDSDKKGQKHGMFRRANSGSALIESKQKKKSWRSHHSLNPSTKNDSRGAGALYLDTDVDNDNSDPQFTRSPAEGFLNVPGLDKSSSLPHETISKDIPPQSPTTRYNEADEFIQKAIQYHEANELEKATYYFKLAAEKDTAESAVTDLHASMAANPSFARHELVLAIYELGICFRHGWGVPKNKKTAAYYFEIAANLGDPDAQNELGFCFERGEGVKRDLKKSAKYFRMAASQGAGILGNSWIYKKKYDEDEN
ncbi:6145_t:CDS:2 [Racocetra fulgida]|uniref:6145_t:CDS:1 n=1 Tax=Racocetra fulgida TaxID=60492 RepID=A0A9N8VRP8_9GLOM|nr:6145_t:CDS:2 [Racocetra fulgida]